MSTRTDLDHLSGVEKRYSIYVTCQGKGFLFELAVHVAKKKKSLKEKSLKKLKKGKENDFHIS